MAKRRFLKSIPYPNSDFEVEVYEDSTYAVVYRADGVIERMAIEVHDPDGARVPLKSDDVRQLVHVLTSSYQRELMSELRALVDRIDTVDRFRNEIGRIVAARDSISGGGAIRCSTVPATELEPRT